MVRIIKWIAIVLGVVLVLGVIAGVVTVRRSYPDASGEIDVPGLAASVEVIRDDYGIAHIYGENLNDIYFAQGYVHAQDRFFEMDFRRHVTSGRLSEIFGAATLDTDKYVRSLGWRRVAEQEVELLSPEARAYLQAYADGVNAFIGGKKSGELSLEYSILGLTGPDYTPEPWEIADSVAWIKAMAWDLRSNVADETQRALAVGKVPADRVEELFPDFPYAEREVIVPSDSYMPGEDEELVVKPAVDMEEAAKALTEMVRAQAAMPTLLGKGGGIGSNSWVVSGERTTTGMPLLANDPHLSASVPGIWHQTGLHCVTKSEECKLDVSGYGFSGLPGIVIGHNDRIAWGFTNLYADVADLYLERVEGDTYLYDGEWLPMETREEEFKVAGGETETITVRSTKHGPIMSDLDEDFTEAGSNLAELNGDNKYEVSLRWTALDPAPTVDAVFKMNFAQNWEEFRDAAKTFAVPSQNLVYADVDGNIGYQSPGIIPIRGKGDGTWPAPGWDSAYEWTSYIPFEELPTEFNPERGFVITANHPVVDQSYKYFLGEPGAYGFRGEAIHELVDVAEKLSVADMTEIQMNSVNLLAREIVPKIELDLGSTYYNEGLKVLKEWDFNQVEDSAGAAFFNEFWRQLLERTFGDELPEVADGDERWMEVVRQLFKSPNNVWWDDARTTQVKESRDEILEESLKAARDELTKSQSKDPEKWEWGKSHELELVHGTLGTSGIGVIEGLFNRGPYPVSGGGGIINATSWNTAEGYGVKAVPSMRMVIDLKDLDSSRWINFTGNSGHAYHSNYIDQFKLWQKGDTLPWHFTAEKVRENADKTLKLVPRD